MSLLSHQCCSTISHAGCPLCGHPFLCANVCKRISGVMAPICAALPHTLWLPAGLAYSPCPLPLNAPHTRQQDILIFQMCPQTVRINGVDVLNATSKQYFALMRIIWTQYCKDLSANLPAGQFTLLTRKDIAGQMPGYVEDLDTVRSYIKRMQARLSKAFKAAFKRELEPDAIIYSAFIEDVGQKKRGYGLNPYTLHVVPY